MFIFPPIWLLLFLLGGHLELALQVREELVQQVLPPPAEWRSSIGIGNYRAYAWLLRTWPTTLTFLQHAAVYATKKTHSAYWTETTLNTAPGSSLVRAASENLLFLANLEKEEDPSNRIDLWMCVCRFEIFKVNFNDSNPTYRVSHQLWDLGILPLQPSCYAHPARFPPAQAESGRLSNISVLGTWNLGLRADG